jgi:hypothetical protein
MDEVQVSSRNTALHLHQTRSPLVSGRPHARPRFGDQSESRQARRRFFFRDPSPLSRSRAYRKSSERDSSKLGLEQELALTCDSLEKTIEAIFIRAGIRSYFGVDGRILMIPCGHGPRRDIVARCFAGSPGRLASSRSIGEGRDLPVYPLGTCTWSGRLCRSIFAWTVLGSELQAERTRFGTVRIVSSPGRSMKASTESIALAGLRSEEPNRAREARKLGLRSGLCFPSIPRKRSERCRFI